MPLFRHRRSTLSEATTPSGHDHGVNVEPIAVHKLRALLHRGSRKSMRLDNDDVRRSVQLSLDDANSNQRRTVANLTVPASMKYRHSRSSTGTGSEDTDNDTGHRPKDHHAGDFGAVTHKTLSPPESASITPPGADVHLPTEDKEEASPIPGAAPVPMPVTPASMLGLSSLQTTPQRPQRRTPPPQQQAPSPSQMRVASVHPPTTRSSPPRPVPTIETTAGSPESTFHTPHTHHGARSSHESEAEWVTPEAQQRPSMSSSLVSGFPPSPSRAALRAEPVPLAQQRRRSSAVSTTSSVGSPRRMAAVLHSPPMPIPIAHLPSLQRAQSATVTTPGWGALAIEGGPRSPALSRTSSRASASNGFPFFQQPTQPPEPAPVPAQNGSKEMTDAEVRRATKAMPVMLRVPSRQPQPEQDEDDGGEAEDDEDDDEFDDEETSSAAPLPSGPPAARSAFANQAPTGTMEAVSEESRSVTPVSVSSPSSSPRAATRLRPNYFERPASRRDTSATPSTQDTQPDDDSSVEESLESGSMDDTGSGSVAMTTIATPASPSTPPHAPVRRPAMYSQVSQSMINLPTPVAARTDAMRPPSPILEPAQPTSATAAPESWAKPPPTPWGLVSPPARKRRLSAGDADGPPPPQYESVSLFANSGPAPPPREEEGRERLPGYWCGVHIEGTLSRKMEFNQPGVQAKDRGWKKYYFVLHGTALFVYKFDPSKVPLRQNEPYLTCSEGESRQFLHVHLAPDHHRAAVTSQNSVAATAVSNARAAAANPSTGPSGRSTPSGRRNTVGLESAIQRNPIIANAIQHARRGTVGSHTPSRRELNSGGDGDVKNPALFEPTSKRRSSAGGDSVASSTASAPIASHMPFAHNQLVHVYGLTGAESGLAADYKKRLHCVRVRAEGQQFMLQTDTARQCVQWIEAFQAATNVAQDLDTRPMPVQQTLPRRRRRAARRTQPAQPPADPNAPPTSDNANTAAFADTPEGNIAAVIAAERAERERMDNERDRMLAEDQAAESQARFRT